MPIPSIHNLIKSVFGSPFGPQNDTRPKPSKPQPKDQIILKEPLDFGLSEVNEALTTWERSEKEYQGVLGQEGKDNKSEIYRLKDKATENLKTFLKIYRSLPQGRRDLFNSDPKNGALVLAAEAIETCIEAELLFNDFILKANHSTSEVDPNEINQSSLQIMASVMDAYHRSAEKTLWLTQDSTDIGVHEASILAMCRTEIASSQACRACTRTYFVANEFFANHPNYPNQIELLDAVRKNDNFASGYNDQISAMASFAKMRLIELKAKELVTKIQANPQFQEILPQAEKILQEEISTPLKASNENLNNAYRRRPRENRTRASLELEQAVRPMENALEKIENLVPDLINPK